MNMLKTSAMILALAISTPAAAGPYYDLMLPSSATQHSPLPAIMGGVPLVLPPPPRIPEGRGPVRIGNNHGGDLRAFRVWVEALRLSGRRVIVDGQVDSAGALVMTLPNACATARATFRVHQVTNIRTGGIHLTETAAMIETYPTKAREIIARRGGLGSYLITIRARDILPPC